MLERAVGDGQDVLYKDLCMILTDLSPVYDSGRQTILVYPLGLYRCRGLSELGRVILHVTFSQQDDILAAYISTRIARIYGLSSRTQKSSPVRRLDLGVLICFWTVVTNSIRLGRNIEKYVVRTYVGPLKGQVFPMKVTSARARRFRGFSSQVLTTSLNRRPWHGCLAHLRV